MNSAEGLLFISSSKCAILTMPAPGLPLAISRGYHSLPLALTSLFHFLFGHNRIQFTSQPSYPEHFAMWSAAGKNKCNLHTDNIIAISPMLISGKRFEQCQFPSHPKQPQKCGDLILHSARCAVYQTKPLKYVYVSQCPTPPYPLRQRWW